MRMASPSRAEAHFGEGSEKDELHFIISSISLLARMSVGAHKPTKIPKSWLPLTK